MSHSIKGTDGKPTETVDINERLIDPVSVGMLRQQSAFMDANAPVVVTTGDTIELGRNFIIPLGKRLIVASCWPDEPIPTLDGDRKPRFKFNIQLELTDK